MENIRIYLVLYVVCVNIMDVYSEKLQTWKMQEHCGNTIGRYNSRAGELVFNAAAIRQYTTTEECQVTIEGEQFSKKTMLAFYFSEFRMSQSCARTNITIATGYSGFGAKSIYGLPSKPFCGHNQTLEEPGQVYISKDNSLIITSKWQAKDLPPDGTFVLKFFLFYKEPCDEDGTDVDYCDSDRCVDTDVRCHDEINPCPSDRDVLCDNSGIVDAIIDNIADILKNVGTIIVVGIGLCFLSVVFKFMKHKYGPVSNFPGIRQLIETRSNNAQSESSRRNSVELTVIDDTTTQEATGFTSLNNGVTDYGTETSSIVSHPDDNEYQSAPEALPTAPPGPYWDSTLAPPPSYDEVLSNEEKYKATK